MNCRLHKQRIVLTTGGSLGDLHPSIAIALGLRARGHESVLATIPCYRQKIEALGLSFCAVRPNSTCVADPIVMQRFRNQGLGTVKVVREWLFPVLQQSYEDTLAAAPGAKLLASRPDGLGSPSHFFFPNPLTSDAGE